LVVAQLAIRPGRSSTTEAVQELRRLLDLVETSSRGSAVLKADLHRGKSTGRMALQTQHPGNSVKLHLDLLVDRLLGSSVLEGTVAIANIAVAATVVPLLGSSPGTTVATTTTADTAVDMVDTVATEVEEEATARVHLLEAPLHGCSRKHTLVTALLAWTTTVLRRHLHLRLLAFRRHPLPAICRRPLPRHLSSGWQSPILTILDQKHDLH
jgi:hypothetical protein